MKPFTLPRRPSYRLLLLLPVNLLLLGALAATFWFDNEVNRGVVFAPDPMPIAYAGDPQVGVNAFNLHVEPDPAAVTRTLELARAMGARYVRMQAPWDDIEIHGRGDFEDRRNVAAIGVVSAWAKYDRIVATANQLDLELVIRLERPPDWAREQFRATPEFQRGLELDGNSTGPPDDFADYGNFVRAFVSRYRGQVRFFQIWNEPNLKNEWNWQTPKPEDFVALLRVGYTAAKEANPEAVILFPSLAPTDGLDFRAPMTELEYLDAVYKAGGAAYFDIMAAQAYGLGQPPDENRYVFLRGRANWSWTHPIDTRNDVSRAVLLREVMERNGDAATAVWIGEFGWNSAPDTVPPERRFTWGQPVSEEQKAAYIIGQIERARREWPWMGVMHVWMLRYGGYREPDPADPTQYFALVGRDWTLLPAYERLREYLAQPAVAGVGAHRWRHPAVEPTPEGWRLRFSGARATLVGGPLGGLEARLNGQPVALEASGSAGRLLLQTPGLPDGVHTLEIVAPGAAAPDGFVVARDPPLPWLWPLLPLLLLGLLVVSSVATTRALFAATDELVATIGRIEQRRAAGEPLAPWMVGLQPAALCLIGMSVGLIIFYRTTDHLPVSALGLAVFAGLALLRPDLGLLFVPLTAPLFFMPKGIWDERFGIRAEGLRFPLHEIVLLVVLGATLANGLLRGGQRARIVAALRRGLAQRAEVVPIGLFLLAGTLGMLLVPAEGRSVALREWRWLIVEPLIFYGLVRLHMATGAAPVAPGGGFAPPLRALLVAWLLGGALVGLIGMLQFGGLNLVPLIGDKVTFSDDRIFVEGVQRVTSVYGHPNNLGLYLGRVWPIAAALALALFWERRAGRAGSRGLLLLAAVGALCAFGGLLVSFSRGAWLGAAAALAALALLLAPNLRATLRRFWWLLALLALLAAGGAAAAAFGIERFNLFGETSAIRLRTWASALAMIRDHPLFGVGLDQFGRLYPQYIDPALAETNERFTAHPHNLLLDIWLRMGLLGLLIFGWLLARFFRQAAGAGQPPIAPRTPLRAFRAGLIAAMTAGLVHGLVDNFYFWPDLAFAFWLLLALAVASSGSPAARPSG